MLSDLVLSKKVLALGQLLGEKLYTPGVSCLVRGSVLSWDKRVEGKEERSHWVLLSDDANVLKLIMVMAAQLWEYA